MAHVRKHDDLDEDDDDTLFAQLEEEIENEDVSSVREIRMNALRKEIERTTEANASHYGHYNEISAEKEVMKICAQEPRCVVHFYHHNFKRCEIMDRHLAKLAQKYTSTRFFRVFVENVPWLVHKLSIQVLPCVMSFVAGSTKDRIVGFEDLGNTDGFQTAVLELKLGSLGVIEKDPEKAHLLSTLGDRTTEDSDKDDVFDLDD